MSDDITLAYGNDPVLMAWVQKILLQQKQMQEQEEQNNRHKQEEQNNRHKQEEQQEQENLLLLQKEWDEQLLEKATLFQKKWANEKQMLFLSVCIQDAPETEDCEIKTITKAKTKDKNQRRSKLSNN
jgi:hypothetical protein